jgi:hypothetical protein
VSDDARTLQNSPSPPRHKESNVLFITNLVRPFTVNQLKELLARTGTIVEGGFWIDKIKSKCYVQVCLMAVICYVEAYLQLYFLCVHQCLTYLHGRCTCMCEF